MGENSTESLNEQLVRDGFVVMPGVLSVAEVAKLRDQVNAVLDDQGIHKAGGTVLPNAAAEAPSLSWIFCHQSIISAVRAATGLGDMVFTMEADLHRNYLASKWHKDTGEQMMEGGYFACDPFNSEDCRVYKVALYLQDHLDGDESLHVRPGSTAFPELQSGSDQSLNLKAGDVVLFDVRITHRGVAPGLLDSALLGSARLFAGKNKDLRAAQLRRKKLSWKGKPERLAVYFAFGAPNPKSALFAQRNMKRQLSQLGNASPELPEALVASFVDNDIATVVL